MTRTRLSATLTISAVLTVLAGSFLYWQDSQGFTSTWMFAGSGIGFSIGGTAALIGFIFGIILGQLNKKMAQLGHQVNSESTPEQFAQLQKIQGQLKLVSPINAISLIVAVVFMAIARYMVF
jgi:hypothetical protein